MGLFTAIFKRPNKGMTPQRYFQMLTGYTPVFTSAPGSIYEMDLTRAAIHSFATFCSKLKPDVKGSAYAHLGKMLETRANPFMTTTKFLYRVATILKVNNTAFIVPIEDELGNITGFFPILPQLCEVVDVSGKPYLRFSFSSGKRAAIEFEKVGIMTQMQYSDDFFGETNDALRPTLQLIHTQNQGIIKGVKNSATIRFVAKLKNMLKKSDIDAERQRFLEENLNPENENGVLIFDDKYADIKQVDSKPWTANANQMKQITENVYRYFRTNEKIIMNTYNEDEWAAYYEGEIEPFAIQLSQVMSSMMYTDRELAHGNSIMWTANRLQYASSRTKLEVSTQLFDRGVMTHNMVMDIWNLPHIEGEAGDRRYIRKEYTEVSKLDKEYKKGGGENANDNDNGEAGDTGSGTPGDGAASDGGEGGTAEEI